MKILFICPYPRGEAPSQRFRFEQYFSILAEKHITYEIHSFIDKKTWKNLYMKGGFYVRAIGFIKGFIKRIILLTKVSKFDYVFIHREATPIGPPIIEWVIAKLLQKPIVYDFDDAIWLEDLDEKGTLLAKFKWKKKVASICKWSYKISTGNEYLLNFAKSFNNNTHIIPTVVDTAQYHNPALYYKNKSDKAIVGWTGTHSTLGYLKKLIPLLLGLYNEIPFILKVISNKKPDFYFPDLVYVEWRKETEIKDLLQMDIGIMPLSKDEWSKGKCGFKIIQYMSLEIPSLASDIGVNSQIISHGENGFLCSNEGDWTEYLSELLNNKNLRNEIGLKARRHIIKNYSVHSTETDFVDLFS